MLWIARTVAYAGLALAACQFGNVSVASAADAAKLKAKPQVPAATVVKPKAAPKATAPAQPAAKAKPTPKAPPVKAVAKPKPPVPATPKAQAKAAPKTQPAQKPKTPPAKAVTKPKPPALAAPKAQAKTAAQTPAKTVLKALPPQKPKAPPVKAVAKPKPKATVQAKPKTQPVAKPTTPVRSPAKPTAASPPKTPPAKKPPPPKPTPKPAPKTAVKPKTPPKPVAKPRPAASLLKSFVKLSEWPTFGYGMGPKLKGSDFDFRFAATPVSGAKSYRGRAAFNVVDQNNHYFVELSDKGVAIGRTEAGIEERIGTISQTSVPAGRTCEVTIKRREDKIYVVRDRQVAALAYDRTFTAGSVALGTVGKSCGFSKMKLQNVGDLYFADDFMRADTAAGDWEPLSGKWEIYALDNPTRSINAFSYIGRADKQPALATVGHWFWSDYEFSVSFKSMGGGRIGAYFCYADPSNHFRLLWGARNAAKAQQQLQIVRVLAGKATVLATVPGSFRPDQWYRMRIVALAPWLSVSVDGRQVCHVKDPWLSGGKVGLYADTKNPTYFDDVTVRRARGFFDDFSQQSPETWLSLGGQWQVRALDAKNQVMSAKANGPSRLVVGQPHWERYRFGVDVSPVAKGSVGLVFAYRDEASYGLFRLLPGAAPVAEIVHMLNGKAKVLSKVALPKSALTKPQRAVVDIEDGVARAYWGATAAGTAWQAPFAQGRAGLYASQAEATFDNVQVTFRTKELNPVFTAHRMFSEETTMANWAAAQSDWHEVKESVAGTAQATRWHRGNFPGDVMVRVNLTQSDFQKGKVGVYLGATDEKTASGYQLTAGAGKLVLTRAGQTKAQTPVPASTSLKAIQFRRLGEHLMAYLDHRPVLVWKDAHPLPGDKLGWHGNNTSIENEDVEVFSDRVLTDAFARAPVTWRTATGIWEVTNRWQCDPRWSFFSGRRDDGPAVLWHKRELNGDLTMEFCAAIKMDYTKTVGYGFASDLNATICADGAHTDTGYSFVFGGWANTKTAIVRQSQVVAEAAKPLIEGNVHRRWWYFKIEKRGPRLRYWVDNKLVHEYTDPKPLTGNRIAIWTYRHGLMLSRFRVSCAGSMPTEPFSVATSADSRCFYDGGKK